MNSLAVPAPDSIKAYSRLGLKLYDSLIMEGIAPWVWGCLPQVLVDHYRDHVTGNHADIGVGTGYCLDHAGFPVPNPRLALIDLQPNCLEYTARRLWRFEPRCYWRDVLLPIRGIEGPRFDSIALNGVLHCLAGEFAHKARAFDNLAGLTKPGTKIFGCTLVSDRPGRRWKWRRRAAHALLNRLRVIDNRRDYVADLRAALTTRFDRTEIQLVGCMALFSAVAR